MILVTAFKPFHIYKTNSSFESLSKSSLPNDCVKAYLSVDLDNTKEELYDLINRINPSLIIHFGQSGRDKEISLERRAQNLLSFKIKDNAFNMPQNERIIEGSSDYLYTKLDIDGLKAYLEENGINPTLSDDAGTFICNYTYYLSLSKDIPVIFIHLPFFTGQMEEYNDKSLDLNVLIKTVELTVEYFKKHGN